MKVNPKVNSDVNKILQDKTLQSLNSAKTSEVGQNTNAKENKQIASQTAKSESAKIDLSPRAQEMKKAADIANNTPDVDEAKVKKLQELIDKGLYKVDARKVADKMVNESLLNAAQED